MDDQNNPSGNAPSEGATPGMPQTPSPAGPAPSSTPPSQPQEEQKCVTCGKVASGGNCVACGQGEMSCTCAPGTEPGSQGGPMGGPTSPVGEPGSGAPAV